MLLRIPCAPRVSNSRVERRSHVSCDVESGSPASAAGQASAELDSGIVRSGTSPDARNSAVCIVKRASYLAQREGTTVKKASSDV